MLHLITEGGNKELRNRRFPLGRGIKKHLRKTLQNYNGDKTVDGYKRLNNLIEMDANDGGIAYNEMKRLKNFFDTYTGSRKSVEYMLNGGYDMELWVRNTLDHATQSIADFKDAVKDVATPKKPTSGKNHIKPIGVDKEPAKVSSITNESKLNESNEIPDFIYDLYEEYNEYYVLDEFKSNPNGKQNWGPLINPAQYQKALNEFQRFGYFPHFPTKLIYQWFKIIARNAVILEMNTILAGHAQTDPTEYFVEVFEDELIEEFGEIPDDAKVGRFVEDLGLYDWMEMPDGSSAWSDFGLQPLFNLLKQYNDNMKPEEVLVLINKLLDVVHARGDLASIFITGGTRVLSQISDYSFTEEKKRDRKVVYITEEQEEFYKKYLSEAMLETFSFEKLSEIPTFKGRYQYCLQQLGPTIGKGTSRAVFQIDDEKVLKLAMNNKGIGQNDAEIDSCNVLSPEYYKWDENMKWIVTEYVLPAKKEDFDVCIGMSFDDFCKFIQTAYAVCHDYRKYRMFRSYLFSEEELENMVIKSPYLNEWYNYIGSTTLVVGDLLRIANYGLAIRDEKPEIVLLDPGFTEHVSKNYYNY